MTVLYFFATMKCAFGKLNFIVFIRFMLAFFEVDGFDRNRQIFGWSELLFLSFGVGVYLQPFFGLFFHNMPLELFIVRENVVSFIYFVEVKLFFLRPTSHDLFFLLAAVS